MLGGKGKSEIISRHAVICKIFFFAAFFERIYKRLAVHRLNARNFVIYRFGLYAERIVGLLALDIE